MNTKKPQKKLCTITRFVAGTGIYCEIKNTQYSYKHATKEFWEQRAGKWVQLNEAELADKPYIRNCLTSFYWTEQQRHLKAIRPSYPSRRQRFAMQVHQIRAASPGGYDDSNR